MLSFKKFYVYHGIDEKRCLCITKKDAMKYKILLAGLFFSTVVLVGSGEQQTLASGHSRNLWQPRAFSSYSLNNVLLLKDINMFEDEEGEQTHHYIGGVAEYMHSYGGDGCGLGATPFWSGKNSMTTGTNNGESDVDVYQFGMGEAITPGKISLNPVVQQFGTELMYFYQQNKEGVGFVAKFYLPIGGMKIDAQLCEKNPVLDLADETVWLEYPAGTNRYPSLTSAFNGGTCNGSITADDKPIALNSGRISPCALTTIGCADVSIVLGCNAINNERGFFMIGAKGTLPTGNVPTARYMLEPVFGRGGHFGLGVELSGAYKQCEFKGNTFDFFVQGEALHLFSGRRPSWRSFDLKQNGPGSKYLLTQFYFPANASEDNPTGRVPSFITQAVNLTTLPVVSSFAVEGSLAAYVNAQRCHSNWSAGLGVEVWGRTRETLGIDYCNILNTDRVNLNDYAVLGRQISTNAEKDEVLTLCEPLARINKSEDVVLSLSDDYDTTLIKDARVSTNRIPSDYSEALDICGARQPGSVSGKVLLSGTYTWKESVHMPAITFFGATEFANSSMINFWSVGLQGSVNF